MLWKNGKTLKNRENIVTIAVKKKNLVVGTYVPKVRVHQVPYQIDAPAANVYCNHDIHRVSKKPRKKHEEEETEVERKDIKDTVAEQ